MIVLGWDIGGSNTKVCRVVDGEVAAAVSRPFEVRHAPQDLRALLKSLAIEVAAGTAVDAHAVTMTAELSRNFRTKAEGVAFVLDAVDAALGSAVRVFAVDGAFLSSAMAREAWLRVAAANWMATARVAARTHRDAVLVDVGTTTTDIVAIAGGEVDNIGATDLERLASGELLYTGAVRTPVEALAAEIDVLGTRYSLAAEGFATAGDVHVWRRDLEARDYAGATADGQPPTRECAGERLRRALCADRDLLDERAVSALADALADAQVARVAGSIGRAARRHPSIGLAVVAGLGAFIGARAARVAGLQVSGLGAGIGDEAARCAPAAAVALLLEQAREPASEPSAGVGAVAEAPRADIDVVVKIGGGLLAHPRAWTTVVTLVAAAARRVLVVPGGGPFADAVRSIDARLSAGDDAAHWMAILAMDQHAELITSHAAAGPGRFALVATLTEARRVTSAGAVAVLAPSCWLRAANPLPHSWDVTSDSIAAWVAGQAGARELVLVKPPGAREALTDAYFERVRPVGVGVQVVPADDIDAMRSALVGRV